MVLAMRHCLNFDFAWIHIYNFGIFVYLVLGTVCFILFKVIPHLLAFSPAIFTLSINFRYHVKRVEFILFRVPIKNKKTSILSMFGLVLLRSNFYISLLLSRTSNSKLVYILDSREFIRYMAQSMLDPFLKRFSISFSMIAQRMFFDISMKF